MRDLKQRLDLRWSKKVASLVVENHSVVRAGKVLQEDLGETVEKRLREGLSNGGMACTLTGVLASKNEEVWVAFKSAVEFGDVDGATVVEDSV